MKRTILLLLIALAFCCPRSFGQGTAAPILLQHPWQGAKVAYLGDSITDPDCYPTQIDKYWQFLQQWLDITPFVYAVNGRQFNDIIRQTDKLESEHHQDVDAILILMGTNDFNAGLPLGEFFKEETVEVLAANGAVNGVQKRVHRTLITDESTFKGRINKALIHLKERYPTKQIILLTPLHRAYAKFSEGNIQPDENYQNTCGQYVDAYVDAIKEAGSIFAMPVIDLGQLSGLNPTFPSQLPYFRDKEVDQLHPSTLGHQRMAATLAWQLIALPVHMESIQ